LGVGRGVGLGVALGIGGLAVGSLDLDVALDAGPAEPPGAATNGRRLPGADGSAAVGRGAAVDGSAVPSSSIASRIPTTIATFPPNDRRLQKPRAPDGAAVVGPVDSAGGMAANGAKGSGGCVGRFAPSFVALV
jgi:hypothetical protein